MLEPTTALRHRRGDGRFRVDLVEWHEDRVVVAFSWEDASGRRHTWAQLLRLRGGMIADIQDYAQVAKAVRASRRPRRFVRASRSR